MALEAVRGEKTIAQLSSEFGVHGNQIRQWRRQLLDEVPKIFTDSRKRSEKDSEELTAELYRQIGQLKVELDWLKKKLQCSVEQKRDSVEADNKQIPVTRQCELLGIARSTYYYKPKPMSELNLRLMRLIDEQYTRTPMYGVPRMTAWLNRQGYGVNHKRVERLMRLMGLQAVYPKRRLTVASNNPKGRVPRACPWVNVRGGDTVVKWVNGNSAVRTWSIPNRVPYCLDTKVSTPHPESWCTRVLGKGSREGCSGYAWVRDY